MNIFLSGGPDVEKSVKELDSVRLNKQILECKTILDGAIAYKNGEKEVGYFKHPVSQFYKDYPDFLAYYGALCCAEYRFRSKKAHFYSDYFSEKCNQLLEREKDSSGTPTGEIIIPETRLYYMEGEKRDPKKIRTTNANVIAHLFQAKLINKWEHDKEEGRPPHWEPREIPKFYEDYLALPEEGKRLFWGFVETRKAVARGEIDEDI